MQTPVVTLNISISPESSMPYQSILASLSPSHSRGMYPFFPDIDFFSLACTMLAICVLLISLCIVFLDLFMFSCVLIIYFLLVFHWINISQFVYPLFYRLISRLFPNFGCYKSGRSEQSFICFLCVCICVHMCLYI